MTNYREILRLHSLRISNRQIAESCGCSRTTVISVLQKARDGGIDWKFVTELSYREVSKLFLPTVETNPVYKMPNYDYVHREMAKSSVTLSLLWVEYCDKCREAGEIPYQSTQFNKYYSNFVKSTKATMHINRKPGEIMEGDWAGQTAEIIDTDTGEIITGNVSTSTC